MKNFTMRKRKSIDFNVDLLSGNILKSLMIFAIPILISNVFQQLYNTMDTMIVGNYLGDISLAAIGACAAIYELLVGFSIGIGNGLSIVTARAYGSDDNKLLKKSVAGSLVIGIFVTIIIMFISAVFLFPLLEILNTPVEIINEAYSYISTVTLFVGVTFFYNLFSGFLRAIGNSFMPLIFLILSSVVNIFLDILLITQFNMGIKGAAIATVIAQVISCLLCIAYIYKNAKILIPSKEHFTFDKELYKELLGQGLSMGLMLSIVSTGTVILQTAINKLGYLIIAGHVAARKLSSFFAMPYATFAMAIATFVSQNKGAGNIDRIKKAVKYAVIFSIVCSALSALLLYFIAPAMVTILSGSSESIVIENGSRYLVINSIFYGVLGMLLCLRSALQGLGRKVIPLVSSIIEFFGKIVFVILFIPSLEYFGVIICEPVIWCLMCIQLIYAFYTTPYIRKGVDDESLNTLKDKSVG